MKKKEISAFKNLFLFKAGQVILTIAVTGLVFSSCHNSSKDSTSSNADSSAVTKPTAVDVISQINDLDSLNYIFTARPDQVKNQYMDKTISVTGSIDKGVFKFYKPSDNGNGRQMVSYYGIETDLKQSDFSNIVPNQPVTFFYNKNAKKFIEEITTPDSEFKLLTSIYSAFSNSSEKRDIIKGLGSNDAETNASLKKDALESLATLKTTFPTTYKSLMDGDFVVGDHYVTGAPVMDFIVIDQVMIQGKVLDMYQNSLNKIMFKLMGAKVVKTKRLIDLDKLPVFIPKVSGSTDNTTSDTPAN
ncbi:hypothetical protein [Mucilaginibacter gotjawali]|uniref:Lipoprotein n=1 Tax=Mucilaginibacter gotjawali TaxID=1550579 RepID=A0A839SN15_9SPHI|nr:hypothetical protein [Mucilaginibacter gotjawali]MBB3058992.1 hypothetical protein [Mucilaginibacter gotjawali]